jgi:hypothetical protein
MSNTQKNQELRESEKNIGKRYSLLAKIFLLIVILLIIWVVIVLLGSLLLSYSYDWTGLSLDLWIIILCGLIGIFIIFELIFYFHYSSVQNKLMEKEKPKPEYIDSKRVHIFTFPVGMEGGIFSKTYIQIDEYNILRLRALMIPPEDLWKKKKNS